MEVPIEAIKAALWWLEDGLLNAELTNKNYRKTKRYSEELNKYLEHLDNNAKHSQTR